MRAFTLLVALFAGCADVGQFCTQIGCLDGYNLDFQHDWTEGTYTITVTLDADTVTCTGTIPINEASDGCDDDRVQLGLSGSQLPVADQALSGLVILATDVTTVDVTVSDGLMTIGTQAFTPAWQTSQPNGVDCPPTCRSASDTWAF
jgi:hypothetical protein